MALFPTTQWCEVAEAGNPDAARGRSRPGEALSKLLVPDLFLHPRTEPHPPASRRPDAGVFPPPAGRAAAECGRPEQGAVPGPAEDRLRFLPGRPERPPPVAQAGTPRGPACAGLRRPPLPAGVVRAVRGRRGVRPGLGARTARPGGRPAGAHGGRGGARRGVRAAAGPPDRRHPGGPYAAIAADLGTTEAAVQAAVVRLRRRYRDALRAEIAATLVVGGYGQVDEAAVNDEIRELFAALAR